MAEYIKLEDLAQFPIRKDRYDKEHGNKHFINGIESVLEYAENLPVADVVPVVHARWVQIDDDVFACSHCRADWVFSEATPEEMELDYCPRCGAKMDGEP